MNIHPLAGKTAPPSMLVKFAELISAYYTLRPDVAQQAERVTFGNDAAIGGLKVVAENGWFALRPSGTEDIYKIYAESFIDEAHLGRIQDEARAMAAKLL